MGFEANEAAGLGFSGGRIRFWENIKKHDLIWESQIEEEGEARVRVWEDASPFQPFQNNGVISGATERGIETEDGK